MEEETPEAKLRNQLSPAYGLADMVLMIDAHPKMKELILNSAKQVVENKKNIDELLIQIENKNCNLPDIDIEKLLDLAQFEIRSLYHRLDIQTSNILQMIDENLELIQKNKK